MTGIPRNQPHLPRSEVIPTFVPSSVFAAGDLSATIARGRADDEALLRRVYAPLPRRSAG